MMGIDLLKNRLGRNGPVPPASAGAGLPAPDEHSSPPTPWLAEKLKEMLGIDFDELKQFGDRVGDTMVAYGQALQRIEARTQEIAARLEAIERKMPPSGFARSITKVDQDGPERF